jgi:uncharacterized protein YcbK (DUF882 family)
MIKSRRRMIKGLGASLAMLAARPALALDEVPRSLSFAGLHTGESLRVTEALQQIDWVLRDFRTATSHPIDPRLLDQLHALSIRLGSSGHYDVISGYRSPTTNAFLAASSSGVAHNSFHMKGMAIDVRVPGVALDRLRDAARGLEAGGVGYYPSSDFVHVDTGPIRHW